MPDQGIIDANALSVSACVRATLSPGESRRYAYGPLVVGHVVFGSGLTGHRIGDAEVVAKVL